MQVVIENKKWNAKYGNQIVEESLAKAIEAIIANYPDKGKDSFVRMTIIAISLRDAEKTGLITLDESDYHYLKKVCEQNIPAVWGLKQEFRDAFELFWDAKSKKSD